MSAQGAMPWAAKSGPRLQNWGTTWALVREIERRYAYGGRITIDVCADAANAKAARYITAEQDALITPWGDPREPTVAWLQPPFGSIGPLAHRAVHQLDAGNCEQVIAYWPARTDREWWHEVVLRRGIQVPLTGRYAFEPPPSWTEDVSSHAEPMALVLFERPLHLPTFSWRREAAPVVGVADLFAGHEEHRADAERGVKECVG